MQEILTILTQSKTAKGLKTSSWMVLFLLGWSTWIHAFTSTAITEHHAAQELQVAFDQSSTPDFQLATSIPFFPEQHCTAELEKTLEENSEPSPKANTPLAHTQLAARHQAQLLSSALRNLKRAWQQRSILPLYLRFQAWKHHLI